MKSWWLLPLLLVAVGCSAKKETAPPVSEEASYHLKDGVIVSSDDAQQWHLFQDGVLHELTFSVEPDLVTFFPNQEQLLLIRNETKSSVYTFTLADGARLLLSTRYPLVYAVFSPSGNEIAFVEHAKASQLGRNSFRVLLYSFKEGSLQSVADHAASPSWSADGRLLLYTDLSKKDSQNAHGVFLYDASKKIPEQQYIKVLYDALTAVFVGKDIYYLQQTQDSLHIRRYHPVTQKDDLVASLPAVFDPSSVYTLQTSEDAREFLVHQTHEEGYTTTQLVSLDGGRAPTEILSQSRNVLWYTENSLVFEPYLTDVFSQDKNVRISRLETSSTDLLSPGLEAKLLATQVGYHTHPFLFATLLLLKDL